MSRPLRVVYPDALYHIISRGNEKNDIFLSDDDRKTFLQILNQVIKLYQWFCHAYCLMGNHYHLLIETHLPNLSQGMRDLNGIYAQTFNRVHNRNGHLFEGRFKGFIVEKESYLLEVARYIALNPVRANIVVQPADWQWSSYRATAGYDIPHPLLTVNWIWDCFAPDAEMAKKEYRKFVMDGLANPKKNMMEFPPAEIVLGQKHFVEKIEKLLSTTSRSEEIPNLEFPVTRPEIKKLFNPKDDKEKRNESIVKAAFQYNYNQKEIAEILNLHYSTVSKIITNSRFKT